MCRMSSKETEEPWLSLCLTHLLSAQASLCLTWMETRPCTYSAARQGWLVKKGLSWLPILACRIQDEKRTQLEFRNGALLGVLTTFKCSLQGCSPGNSRVWGEDYIVQGDSGITATALPARSAPVQIGLQIQWNTKRCKKVPYKTFKSKLNWTKMLLIYFVHFN